MSSDEVAFWGRSARGSDAAAVASRQADRAVELLSALLPHDARITIVLASGWSTFARVTVAVTETQLFIVRWNRRGDHPRIMTADRADVRAKLVSNPDGGYFIRFWGPWGALTVDGFGSERFREVVDFLNRGLPQE